MESRKKEQLIAWDISYELMTRSQEPLMLFMLHPGGEQYNCLALMVYDGQSFFPRLLITLNGTNIHEGNITISPYPKLYKKNKQDLLDQIARQFNIRLADSAVRECPTVSHLMKILALKNVTMLPAWYNGSYHCTLENDTMNFPHYPLKDEEDYNKHLPWWLIQANHKTIAIVNLETATQINEDGIIFDLNTECKEAENSLMYLIQKQDFTAVIDETRTLLNQSTEWRARYEGYAQKITENLSFIKSVRESFRQWTPLAVYLNTTSAQNAKKTVGFELRYYGQTVAKLNGYNDGKHKLSTKGLEENNRRDFGCAIQLNGVDWAGPEAAKFRKYFKDRKTPRNKEGNTGNEEHRLESLWLTELLKSGGKALPNTKAVEIGKVRFPMPTPLSASNHKAIKYSGLHGGGIDIFARTGTGGGNTFLCIMELKDENVKSEPPKDALKQAIAYSTFIRELLRSECGQQWWALWGFNGELPKQLILYAACVMPSSSCNDYSFNDMSLDINGDIIKLHYVYFVEENNRITKVETSLKW